MTLEHSNRFSKMKKMDIFLQIFQNYLQNRESRKENIKIFKTDYYYISPIRIFEVKCLEERNNILLDTRNILII